uniref:Uncharacterized protein n=1 Tax=Octopus bimaculoides TaxID=37653 RepID=A0A0L8H5T7_OCTBM
MRVGLEYSSFSNQIGEFFSRQATFTNGIELSVIQANTSVVSCTMIMSPTAITFTIYSSKCYYCRWYLLQIILSFFSDISQQK